MRGSVAKTFCFLVLSVLFFSLPLHSQTTVFDKEKLLSVYDATVENEPMRSRSGAQPDSPAGKEK